MIRPIEYSRTLPYPTRDGFEKLRLHDPVFVVALLRPRIGKQDPDFLEGESARQLTEKLSRLALDENAVGEARPFALAARPGDALATDIDSDEETGRMCDCLCDEKVPVSAPDFPGNLSRGAEIAREFCAKRAAPANNFFEECGIKLHGDTWLVGAPARNKEEG